MPTDGILVALISGILALVTSVTVALITSRSRSVESTAIHDLLDALIEIQEKKAALSERLKDIEKRDGGEKAKPRR